MAFEDDLKRKLRRLADELERRGNELHPVGAGARPAPKLRRSAAGLGLAACIAAIVALVAQIIPSDPTGSRDIRPAAGESNEPGRLGTPTPYVSMMGTPPPPPDSYPAPPTAVPPPPRSSPEPPADECRDPGQRRAAPSGIRITVEIDPGNPQLGETATVTARFKNERPTPAHNEQGRPFVDFVVYDSAGQIVWNPYPRDGVFTSDARVKDYAPGEEDSESMEWNLHGCSDDSQPGPQLRPGRYTIRAIWSGNLGGWSEPVAFEIRPR